MKEDEASSLFLARISKFESDTDEHGCPTHAQVVPVTADTVVTRPFAILWICRGNLGRLEVGTLVVCGRFADGSGIVLCRADGEHTNVFPKDLRVEGDVQIDGKAHVDETVTADEDVIGGDVSLVEHTHMGVHGETTRPL